MVCATWVAATQRPGTWRKKPEANACNNTPEAECQWWASRLGDERGLVERLEPNTQGFFPSEGLPSGGFFLSEGAHGEGCQGGELPSPAGDIRW